MITINSSNGYIEINDDGDVLKTVDETTNRLISNIVRFDMTEYKTFWNVNTLPEDVDILNMGYWYKDEYGMIQYEEPAHDWRKELKLNQNELAKEKIMG